MSRRLRVVIQQQVLPAYRVPFFQALGERVDLSVTIAGNARIPGVHVLPADVDGRTFETIPLLEKKFFGGLRQEGAINCAIARNADILVSGGGYLPSLAWSPMGLRKLQNASIRLMTWGCQGYEFDGPGDWSTFLRARLRRRLHHAFLGAVYRRYVDGFIGYSAHTLDYVRYAYRIPAAHLFLAENAVDTSALEAAYRDAVDGSFERKPDRIAFVGRLIDSKRVDNLIRAFVAVSAQYPDAELIIIGDGPAQSSLRRLAESLSRSEAHIRFLGHIGDKAELAKVLVMSGLFVLPGPGGLAINEAMAAGLAVICSRGDGTEQHLVVNGENGLLLPSGDVNSLQGAISGLLGDPQRILKMGERSFHLITERFTLTNLVNRYFDALQTVSGGLPSRRPWTSASP